MATGVLGVHYWRSGTTWAARGRATLLTDERSNLVIEVDRPVRGVNTGVLPGVARTDLRPAGEGVYTMAAGETLTNRTVYGRIKVASYCTLRNVRILGSPPDANPGINSHKPLIDATASSTTNVLLEDCDLTPSVANESDQVYGVKGRGVTLRRCVVARCVDSLQLWNGSVTVEQSWLGDCYLRNPDRTRSDGQATHNDVGGQLQGGGGTITYRGCTIDATIPNFSTWMANGNNPSLIGLLMTRDVGTAPDVLRVLGSWLRGGTYPVNISTPHKDFLTGGWTTVEFLRNRIEKGGTTDGSGGWHAIASTSQVQSRWTFPGTGGDANVDVVVSGTGEAQTWTPTGNPMRFRAG